MMGSYNFTMASRNCHLEDAVVFAPAGPQMNSMRDDIMTLYNLGEQVIIPKAHDDNDVLPTRPPKQQRYL